MRKSWIAALALAAVLAVAGGAVAANTYQVHIANGGPGKGSMKKPSATFLNFGYKVGDSENMRPFVIKQYRIAAEGTRSYPKSRPTCTYAQATDPNVTDPSQLTACTKANVGSGTINNLAGAPNDRSQSFRAT